MLNKRGVNGAERSKGEHGIEGMGGWKKAGAEETPRGQNTRQGLETALRQLIDSSSSGFKGQAVPAAICLWIKFLWLIVSPVAHYQHQNSQ